MERYEESSTALLEAVRLDANSERMLNYLGSTQAENPNGPSPPAIDAVCARADSHPRDPVPLKWCGALLFRKAYVSGDEAGAKSAIARLRSAAALDRKDPVAVCFLGRTLFWTRQFIQARPYLESCVRLNPESSEEHYRLSLLYQELNLNQAAAEQSAAAVALKAESERVVRDNVDLLLLSTPAQTNPHAKRVTERTEATK
jgi:tetratricopeptide (TPR) repeat protein